MGHVFSPKSDYLTIQSFEKLLHEFQYKEGFVTIDLRKIKFIDPFGMVGLILIAKWLAIRSQDIFYVMPESQKVNSYLIRMSFWREVENYVHIYPGIEERIQYQGIGESDVLLELTPIKVEEDVENAVEVIARRMHRLLVQKLQLDNDLVTKFCVSLAEICQNIPQHSQDWGFTAAQTYLNNDKPFVKLAVGDLGVGIRSSLWGETSEDWMRDRDAIFSSLQLGVSRYSEPGRGLGLAQVKRYVDDFNGKMHIRSGCARLYISNKKKYAYKTAFFPGTQISIELPTS